MPLTWTDLRHLLPVEPANPLTWRALSMVNSIVVHWDGGPVIAEPYDALAYYAGEARFHIRKDWGTAAKPVYGYGLMYHSKIHRSGGAYLTRPFEHVVWHAGAINDRSLAVGVDATVGQDATDEQVETLGLVLDEWTARYGVSRSRVFGHSEAPANQTSCPGPRLLAFVRRYRGG